ncbi:family 1 glycosylhydrolase [Amycolatopsis sp. NPDC051061]|uniref:glycoside hydrolase family 1 protein n=1 Tax=Amycolatopsis sp. NPDC051061 TaxID=3155042 RepID=UPI0034328694
MSLAIPDEFLWGACTAGHQVEGQDVNSDWWWFEHLAGSPMTEPSGDACDSLHRYPEDIAICRDLGLTAYRFSIEWSRIEPADGEFSRGALDHYRRVLELCESAGLVPVVTFQHCSLPNWVGLRGGWLWEHTAERFQRFCDHAARYLGRHLGYVVTLTEPDVIANLGYRYGGFPGTHVPDAPLRAGDEAAERAAENLARAHVLGRDAIRQVAPAARVGMSLATVEWGCSPGYEEQLKALQRQWEGDFFDVTAGDDYFGVASYTRLWAGPEGSPDELPDGAPPVPMFLDYPPGTRRTSVGYEFRPESVEAAIRRAREKTGLPILVTETGVATADDRERVEWIDRSVAAVGRCLADGIDIRGYFYRSLLDDFEWGRGYAMRFGLVEVDRQTFERRLKPSARLLGEYATGKRTR